MDKSLEELAQNPIYVALISLAAGVILNSLISGLRKKTKALGYISFSNRIGVSASDAIFGVVRVTWQGHDVRNLHSSTIEVENETSSDLENVELKIYPGQGTVMLNEKTEIVDTPYIVEWAPNYAARLKVPEGEQASQQQLDEYNRSREYAVPVLNRGQKLRFTYLCTRPSDDEEPGIFISTPSKGIKLKRRKNPYVLLRPIFGVPVPSALYRGLGASLIFVILFGLYAPNVWAASIGSMAFGLFAQPIGAVIYRLEKFVKSAVAG